MLNTSHSNLLSPLRNKYEHEAKASIIVASGTNRQQHSNIANSCFRDLVYIKLCIFLYSLQILVMLSGRGVY